VALDETRSGLARVVHGGGRGQVNPPPAPGQARKMPVFPLNLYHSTAERVILRGEFIISAILPNLSKTLVFKLLLEISANFEINHFICGVAAGINKMVGG
jgi:hypothetical protein